MTWYTFFKSVHITAAAVWFGGALMIQAFAFRILRTGDARRQAEFAKDSEVVGMRVFIPAVLAGSTRVWRLSKNSLALTAATLSQ